MEGGVNQSSAVFSDLDLRLVLADISIVSPDFSLAPLLTDLDIHGNDKYAPIEFAGAASTVIFSVSLPPFLLLSNFCFFFSLPLLYLFLSLSLFFFFLYPFLLLLLLSHSPTVPSSCFSCSTSFSQTHSLPLSFPHAVALSSGNSIFLSKKRL